MQKTRTTVTIAGRDYTIASYDDATHVKRVAELVDRRLGELSRAVKLPDSQVAVMVALDVADEMIKAQDEIRRLRAETAELRAQLEALETGAVGE